jgi:hypothetical protein
MTVLRFNPARQTGPTQFHRHLAVHMANAELQALGHPRPLRRRWSRWQGWFMAFAIGFVIWALVSWRTLFA